MKPPTAEALAAIAANQGVPLNEKRLEAVAAFFEGLWPRLEELRAVELSFLDDFIEPAHAERWIENGGSST